MTELSNQPIIIYKTYTPASARAQKNITPPTRVNKHTIEQINGFVKNIDRINAKYRERRVCPHCNNTYSRAYLPRHIRQFHN